MPNTLFMKSIIDFSMSGFDSIVLIVLKQSPKYTQKFHLQPRHLSSFL